MWKFLLLISVVPIVIALAARWWFGMRVLAGLGGRICRCDLDRWLPAPSDGAVVHRAEETAAEFGKQLREKALAEWREHDPKAVKSRESGKRFGMAVPPLAGIVAVMAVFVAKIPVLGAIAATLAATAIAALIGVLSITPELAALTRAAKRLRESKSFPSRDDEEAVIRCALALAWKETLPPILAAFQR